MTSSISGGGIHNDEATFIDFIGERAYNNIKEIGKTLAVTIPQNEHISDVSVEIASPINHTTINIDDNFTLEKKLTKKFFC